MDGVIVDNVSFHFDAWREFCNRYHLQVTDDEIKAQFGKTNYDYCTTFFKSELSTEVVDSLANEKEGIYRDIFSRKIKPANGLVDFLNELKNNNISIAIATSAPKKNVDFVLDTLNIRSYFGFIVDETLVKEGKHKPDIYYKAAELLNAKPENCVVFDDWPVALNSAQSIGMKTVAVATVHALDKLALADLIINDFTEVNVSRLSKFFQND